MNLQNNFFKTLFVAHQVTKNHLLTCLCAGSKVIVPVNTNIKRIVIVVVELRNASTLIHS